MKCKYCERDIPKGGAMDSHVHFKHLRQVLEYFRGNPMVRFFIAAEGLEKALPEKGVTS